MTQAQRPFPLDTDDTEGHGFSAKGADGERAEGDDDTEGYGATRYALGSAAATLAVSASRAR